jgi:spoIIIJ-associated protein
MDLIQQEGRTVDEAITQALEKLQITREEADVEIVDEGSKGIFGLIGSKNAVIRLKVKVDPVKIGKEFLEKILDKMPLDASLEVVDVRRDEQQVLYNISSPDLGIIIGHRGETLDALQYLTSLAINKLTDSYYRVLLDAEGYRERREHTLERLANKLAKKALTTGHKVMLEPMPPHERRIIHITLRNDNRVNTYSEGKEPFRRVMIVAATEKYK